MQRNKKTAALPSATIYCFFTASLFFIPSLAAQALSPQEIEYPRDINRPLYFWEDDFLNEIGRNFYMRSKREEQSREEIWIFKSADPLQFYERKGALKGDEIKSTWRTMIAPPTADIHQNRLKDIYLPGNGYYILLRKKITREGPHFFLVKLSTKISQKARYTLVNILKSKNGRIELELEDKYSNQRKFYRGPLSYDLFFLYD